VTVKAVMVMVIVRPSFAIIGCGLQAVNGKLTEMKTIPFGVRFRLWIDGLDGI